MAKSRFTFNWDDHPEVLEDLERRWALGQAASIIAKALGNGISRNAVLGRVHRMGLKSRPPTMNKKQTYKPKPPKPPKMTVEIPVDCPPPTVPPETIPDRGCRYISGDPSGADWQACGNTTVKHGSWCEYHYGVVYDLAAMERDRKKRHG